MSGALAPVRQAKIAGHFGEWMQGRLGPEGPLALVSVACPVLKATAQGSPGPFSVTGDADARIAKRFFEALGEVPAMSLTVKADAVAGGGAGMSTAALLAMAEVAGVPGNPIAAALAAEGAVDPLMQPGFDQVLWASREARVLDRFAPPPDFRIVGGFWGEPERTDPADLSFPDISDLVEMWRNAAARADRAALAGLATEAARRTTALRGPKDDPTLDLARQIGSLGIIRAHTGSARGLLLGPDAPTQTAMATLEEAGFSSVLVFQTGGPA